MANFNWTFVNVDGVVNVSAISASSYVSASTIYATTITASNFVTVNKLSIDVSGSTSFGDSNDDTHIRTGSLSVYRTADTATLPAELLKLEIGDEGVDMNIGSGPGIDFFVGETGGSDYAGTIAVVREQAADANTDSAMVFHTTTDDQVKANDREKMRITSAGKVGIGTTNPAKTLTVVGEVSASATITGSAFETATTVINSTHISSSLTISGAAFFGNGAQLTGMSPITSYNTVGDNRVITSVNSSTIAGEANLTFDGSKLSAVGQISASLGVTGSSLETATTVINSTHISSSLNISGANFYGNGAQLTGMSPITSYNTVGDNRVLTSVDSSTIAGEASLTFDGSKLSAVGQISASLGVTGSSVRTLNTVIDATHVSSSLNLSASAFYGDGSTLSGIINSYANSGNNRIITSVDSTSVNSEANLTFDGTDLVVASSTASRPRFYIENQNADENPSQLIFHKTSSSPAEDDTVGRIAFQSYDSAGNATIYGQIEGEIKKPNSGGERGRIKFTVAEFDGTLTEALTLQGSNVNGKVDVTIANGNLTVTDDNKLYFGTGVDASIEYNEDGDDLLIISGSATGTVISGSKLILDTTTVASGAIAGPGSYLGVTTTGQIVLTASAAGGGSTSPGGSDTQVQYNNGGSFGGVASLTFNDSTGDLNIIDDKKLFFGTNSDASIEYDENGSDKLIISGAHGGIYVSGSGGLTVAVNDGLTVTSATDDTPVITIENTSDGVGGGALNFKRTTTDEAANDIIGSVNFFAKDAAGNEHIYAAIQGLIDDPTSGGEEGRLIFKVAEFDGNQQEGLRIEGQASNGIVDVRVSNGSMQLKDLGGAGTTPASGFGGLYVNGDNLYFVNDSGTSAQLNAAAGSSTAYNSFTANYTVTTDHDIMGIVTTGSAITASLASAATYAAGQRFIFKDVSGSCSGSGHIVISASQNHVGQNIDGQGIVKIQTGYGAVTLASDGVASFYIVSTN
jgi:hypothetical protein